MLPEDNRAPVPEFDSRASGVAHESSGFAKHDANVGLAPARAVLKPRMAAPFYGRHPWVFRSAVARIESSCADGDVVDLTTDQGEFVARGIVNRHSRLMVRLYAWSMDEALDDAFWRRRIERAVLLRRQRGYLNPDGAARLVYSEADGLSGLVVDRYAGHLVVQVNALGVARRLEALIAALTAQLSPHSVTLRYDAAIAAAEGIDTAAPACRAGLLAGRLPDGPVFIDEHGLRYGVDLAAGQKTGFYLDQRDNRRVAATYLADRRVLDLFCYSGGFGLAASRLGGAREVVGVDTSDRAIALAQSNARLNGISNARFEQQDAFAALDRYRTAERRFDAVILDPPKFARTRQDVDDALRAYQRLNRAAVESLERDGILVTCSCSGSVGRDDFLRMLGTVARKSGREIQVLEQRGASPDHPISAVCPEGEYLKCFICRVP